MSDPLRKRDALRDEDPILLDRDDRATVIPAVRRGARGDDPEARDSAQPDMPPAFWQSEIDRAETVLWFGSPDPAKAEAAAPRTSPLLTVLSGAGFVSGIALLVNASEAIWIKVLGMALFVLSGAQIARTLKPGTRRLHYLHYLVTDRAIYIASVRPGDGRRVQRFPITARLPVTVTDNSVRFTVGTRRRRQDDSDQPVIASFQNITDPAGVYALIRGIQKGME